MNIQEKSRPETLILGIDPGSIHCGYGLIVREKNDARYLASGTISPPSSYPLHLRLRYIYEALGEIIHEHRPDCLVVEKIFFAKGAKAALSLGHARGVVLLAAANSDLPLYEHSALEVKKAVVGFGRAEKSQVQEMVKLILGLKGSLPPDSADALALALCYMNTIKFTQALQSADTGSVR